MRYGQIKTQAAMNKEMLLGLYEQWKQSHPEIVARYPNIDPAWSVSRIDRYTTLIGRDIITDQVKYERDTLLMMILDGDEFGPGAFERAVEKLKDRR